MNDEACVNCFYSSRRSKKVPGIDAYHDVYVCRRYPPNPEFTEVSYRDWCGEHKAKEIEA